MGYEPGNDKTSPFAKTVVYIGFAPKGYSEAQLDEINSMISKKIIEDGYAFIVTTVLKGKRVLRLCLINGNTTTDDVIGTIDYLKKISHSLG